MKPYLILSSFGTGSTYLRRSLTFWIHELLDSRVSNPHELLNGIALVDNRLIKQWMDINEQSVARIQQ